MNLVAPTRIKKIEAEAWATPTEGWTLDALVAEMERIGNQVLEVDREGNRVKVLAFVQEF